MIPAMRDVIVAGNWKMHTTPADAGDLARTIAARTRVAGVTRVICPPFVSLAVVRDALAETDPDVGIGAQNVHHELQGAYTGEISAPMLAGLADWVILGHSERRRDAAETDEQIGRKLGRAVDAALRPILCVGERLEEREAGDQDAVVERQLRGALDGHLPATLDAAGLVIAYEPVWAIGTGRNASGRDAAAMADVVRATAGRSGLARRGRGRADPVRRQRHLGQHRRVPGRARDRRRARRWRVAQAGRDGRHRGAGRTHGSGPQQPPRDRASDPARSSSSSSMGSASAATRRPTRSPHARMPVWRGLLESWPHSTLRASEDAVGLPAGQMGNSEVGHLNLGAGRPVLQDLPRIDAAIADGSFATRPALLEACRRAAPPDGRLHLISLIGPGGVHANDRHLVALVELAAAQGVPAVRVHALLDGRDTAPRSALGHVADLERRLAVAHPDARIASVGGRYYAMDRDQRWDRVERGYDAIVHGVGEHAPNATAAIEAGYERGENDEFLLPTVIDGVGRHRSLGRPGHPRQLPGRPGTPADPRAGRTRSSTASTGPRRTAGRPRPACWS